MATTLPPCSFSRAKVQKKHPLSKKPLPGGAKHKWAVSPENQRHSIAETAKQTKMQNYIKKS